MICSFIGALISGAIVLAFVGGIACLAIAASTFDYAAMVGGDIPAETERLVAYGILCMIPLGVSALCVAFGERR